MHRTPIGAADHARCQRVVNVDIGHRGGLSGPRCRRDEPIQPVIHDQLSIVLRRMRNESAPLRHRFGCGVRSRLSWAIPSATDFLIAATICALVLYSPRAARSACHPPSHPRRPRHLVIPERDVPHRVSKRPHVVGGLELILVLGKVFGQLNDLVADVVPANKKDLAHGHGSLGFSWALIGIAPSKTSIAGNRHGLPIGNSPWFIICRSAAQGICYPSAVCHGTLADGPAVRRRLAGGRVNPPPSSPPALDYDTFARGCSPSFSTSGPGWLAVTSVIRKARRSDLQRFRRWRNVVDRRGHAQELRGHPAAGGRGEAPGESVCC